jgi:hypothetical protein
MCSWIWLLWCHPTSGGVPAETWVSSLVTYSLKGVSSNERVTPGFCSANRAPNRSYSATWSGAAQ